MKKITALWTALAALLPAIAIAAPPPSAITQIEITKSAPAGNFGGVNYLRIEGEIHGAAAISEPVAGLAAAANGQQLVPYDTRFEAIIPQAPKAAGGIVVEADNRGMAMMMFGAAPNPAKSAGPGLQPAAPPYAYLLAHHIAIAGIEWQSGIAKIPANAQGVGEVIMRDFGRMLGGAFPAARGSLPVFHYRILYGVSQSAWMVNSVIAEGFNTDPATGHAVYQAAFTRDGSGNVLAINRFADGGTQFPYVPPDIAPLTPRQLLSRPASDPILVDTATINDFYRVRASIFARAASTPNLHRYATAAPHAPGTLAPAAYVFGVLKCNGGVVIPLDPMSDALYARPLLLALANAIGLRTSAYRLPPDAPFVLTPAGAAITDINRLGDILLFVPKIGAHGAPEGGMPMIDAVLPTGTPAPPALPPVGLRSITDTCGDFSGWQAFTPAEMQHLYTSRAHYWAQARRQADRLVATGWLLPQDESAAMAQVTAQLPPDFK